jgi:hypothetical protein
MNKWLTIALVTNMINIAGSVWVNTNRVREKLSSLRRLSSCS